MPDPKFIIDFARKAALSAVQSHVKRKDSILLIGEYGTGKTELLKQIRQANAVRVSSLGGVYQILARMAKAAYANPRHKDAYMDTLINHPRPIIIDEAQHLPEAVLPYLKVIMDAGNPLVLAARPEMQDNLRKFHADVLSRLTVIKMSILSYEDMLTLVPDFNADDFSIIYNSLDNMRAMATIIKNCRDYAEQNSIQVIDYNVIELFIGGE